MLNTQVIKSFTDLRSNPAAIAQLAREAGEVCIVNRSRPELIITSVADYQAKEDLLDKLLDKLDAIEINQRKKTAKPSDFISHEQLMQELGL
jgi:PHD/YefM family antitoxin component YafN of YafNO toxin-antitoxin module